MAEKVEEGTIEVGGNLAMTGVVGMLGLGAGQHCSHEGL